MITIREAAIHEIPAIVDFMRQFETESKHIRIEPVYATRMYTNMVKSGVAHMFIMDDDGVMIGGIGCIVSPDLMNGDLMAIETYWFVSPDHRGHGIRLVSYLEQWAREHGCKSIAMIHLTDSHPKRLELLYQRRGYIAIETHYVKELRI